jgi:hypothetical protein
VFDCGFLVLFNFYNSNGNIIFLRCYFCFSYWSTLIDRSNNKKHVILLCSKYSHLPHLFSIFFAWQISRQSSLVHRSYIFFSFVLKFILYKPYNMCGYQCNRKIYCYHMKIDFDFNIIFVYIFMIDFRFQTADSF